MQTFAKMPNIRWTKKTLLPIYSDAPKKQLGEQKINQSRPQYAPQNAPKNAYNATGKVRRMAKNIGFRMELLGTPKVRLGVPA